MHFDKTHNKANSMDKQTLATLGKLFKEEMATTANKHSTRGRKIKEQLGTKTNGMKDGLIRITPDSLEAVENAFNEITVKAMGRREDIDYIIKTISGQTLENIMEEATDEKKRKVDLILKYAKENEAPDYAIGQLVVKNMVRKDYDVRKQLVTLFGGGTAMISLIMKTVMGQKN